MFESKILKTVYGLKDRKYKEDGDVLNDLYSSPDTVKMIVTAQ
jgi:hypothetical protein